ncbi:M23 family metallopeptidase [Synechocystis sp. PCC 7509]|uniref:M23 family metallopeptidase n=1 Tax=Synechocystis sp. PCC 7509 TaxID=927677 RepID=UPI000683D8DE|nr:M23 family metallopeptidase [Synechocystis sp. PCC 7509]
MAIITALIIGVTALPFATKAQVDVIDNDAPTNDNLTPNTFSFDDIEPIQSHGSFSAPGWGSITWTPGTRPEQLFTVGMFRDSFGFQNLSLNQIGAITGQSVTDAPLSSFSPVQNLTVSQLVSLIPQLGQLPVSMSPPIQALAQQQGVDTALGSVAIETISPLLQGTISQLGSSQTEYSISQIPGLENVALKQIPDWENAQIADIPGLSSVPLIDPFSLKDYFIPFDIPFGMSPCKVGKECREFNIDNTASGNWNNSSISCVGAPCSHIEVTRRGNDTNKIRWISKEQKVPGGNGYLCLKEPTGRFPFGKNPKVVLENIDEETGKVEFALYFSVRGPYGAESAHCFGPFPMPFWGERKEGQLVLFGSDKLSTKTPLSDLVRVTPNPSQPSSAPAGEPQNLPPPTDCKGSPSTYVRPTVGPVSDIFGYRPRRGRWHWGIDVAPPYGTPIVAVSCGVVSLNDWVNGYGWVVQVTHTSGKSWHAHMPERSSVQVGQQVKRGERIGRVGSTGRSTGPHLHFEWTPNGSRRPVDPKVLGVF